jgi:hypothetical protein
LTKVYPGKTFAMNGECNSGEYIAKSFYCEGHLFKGDA